MELNLDVLAPYLPMKLMIWREQPEVHKNSFFKMSEPSGAKEMSVVTMMAMIQGNKQYTPMLVPLSELTDELIREMFYDLEDIDIVRTKNQITVNWQMYGQWKSFSINTQKVFESQDYPSLNMPVWAYNRLLRFHIDLFYLIENGLAVNKNEMQLL